MRYQATRDENIPDGFNEVQRDDSLGVLVVADAIGTCVKGFSGRRQRADFYLRFPTKTAADAHVATWLDGIKQRAKAKAARSAVPHVLKVGDVLRSSWGYEQTNVDYYEVVSLAGAKTVELREIAGTREDTGDMQGISIPAPGKYIGEAFRRRVGEGGAVKIGSCEWAFKKETIRVAGVEVFAPDRWTAYA
jgi:hypothetical protein